MHVKLVQDSLYHLLLSLCSWSKTSNSRSAHWTLHTADSMDSCNAWSSAQVPRHATARHQ